MSAEPFEQFKAWFEDASEHHEGEPNAMALATARGDGTPSVRMVLLKSFDSDGFVFATNYSSRKGRELLENPSAALLFFWEDMERQVRIEGRVEKTSPEESDAIFSARPIGSRVAAVVSAQSEIVESRKVLETAYAEGLRRPEPTRPENWGGYRLTPVRFEFWQGGVNRLHDRFEYLFTGTGWDLLRLQP
jgi:pyridoxamine 5'-phosphate oxidase